MRDVPGPAQGSMSNCLLQGPRYRRQPGYHETLSRIVISPAWISNPARAAIFCATEQYELQCSGEVRSFYLELPRAEFAQRFPKERIPVSAAIDSLSRFQTGTGTFGYAAGGFSTWPDGYRPHDWTSSYVGHFLLEAERAGYIIPAQTRASWLSFQQQQARRRHFSLQKQWIYS